MKLFKKVMASVLAGVMALSMVACSTASTVPPTQTPVAPTATLENEIVSTMETYRNVTYGQVKPADVVVSERNHKILETIVELLNANPNSNLLKANWSNEGEVSIPLETLVTALQYKGIKTDAVSLNAELQNGFYVIGNDKFVPVKTKLVKMEITLESGEKQAVTAMSLYFTNDVKGQEPDFNGAMEHKAYNVLAYAAFNAGVATSPVVAAADTTISFGKLSLVYSSQKLDITVPVDFIAGLNPTIPY